MDQPEARVPTTFMTIVQVSLGVAYPVLIFVSLSWLEPREVGLVILGLALLRLAILRSGKAVAVAKAAWAPIAAVALVSGLTAIWNEPLGLLLAPVLVNASLLATFGFSLRRGQPMIEKFARLQVGDLPQEEVGYCRSVTKVWCAFFAANGSIALYLAIVNNIEAWVLFTGLIAYVMVGILFAIEYVYRHWKFRRYVGGIADPVLKRYFPPRP